MERCRPKMEIGDFGGRDYFDLEKMQPFCFWGELIDEI